MNKNLLHVTYQTFPAQTANSLQTISNIRYLIKNGLQVSLYFPLREKLQTKTFKILSIYRNF